MKFVNLTPHKIIVRGREGDKVFEPSGTVARVESKEYPLGEIATGIEAARREFGKVEGLPENNTTLARGGNLKIALMPHFHYSSRTGNHGMDKWSLLPGRYIAASVSYSNSGKGGWTLYSVVVRKPADAQTDDPSVKVLTPAEKKELPEGTETWISPNKVDLEPLKDAPEWLIRLLPGACKAFLYPEPHN